MLLRDKRRRLASLMNGSGVSSVLERMARRPGLLVVNYHRIGDARDTHDFPGVFSATEPEFLEQVDHLARRYRPIDLTELIEVVDRGGSLQEPRILFTFDDAYRDQGERALPALIRRKIPAVLFVATGFLDDSRLPWWDLVSRVAGSTTRLIELELPNRPPLQFDPNTTPRPTIRDHLIQALWETPGWDAEDVHHQLLQSSDVELNEAKETRSLFLDWEEVRRLRDQGVAIGSHTLGHRRLGELSDEEQAIELGGSRRELTARLGEPPLAIAYPFGGRNAVNDRTAALVEAAGYRLGFRFDGGINPGRIPHHQRFDLARVGVSWTDSTSMVRARSALLTAWRRTII